MIKIEHLGKDYGNIKPLVDVNAEINDGEVISIIGPSGTGKSTLLRCINMLEKPTSGKIYIDGEEITAKGCRLDNVRRKMGMVFQSFNLFAHMNVIDNITYAPIKLLGMNRQEAQERARELLKTVSLSDKELSYPDELSGGQKQRIAIARTLAMKPKTILFDEPTSALDPTMVGEVLAVIRMLAQQGMTMLIVTHEMNFAYNVSSRIWYMDSGVIYEDGTPEQIFKNPRKEKTRQFINKLKVLEFNMSGTDCDLLGLNSQIEQFGRKHLMSQGMIYAVQVVAEELCVQTILPSLGDDGKIRFMLEYTEQDGHTDIIITYKGKESNPFDGMDEISRALLEHSATEKSFSYENGMCRLELILNNF